MSNKPAFGKLEIDATMEAFRGKPEPETPFRILVFGDFGGRENRRLFEKSRIKNAKPIAIDRDDFDNVLEKLGVKISAAGRPGLRTALEFKELDDFHPDRILDRVEALGALRRTRENLNDPVAYSAAASEVRSWAKIKSAETSKPAATMKQTAVAELPALGNLLDQMLDAAPSRANESNGDDEFQAFLREIAAPYLAPREDPQKPELIGCVDEAIGKLMRSILHGNDFQALEAAWRSLYFLVRGLETGTDLK